MSENDVESALEDVNDAILAYLDYVAIKIEKNPDYQPHPIIRALLCAVSDEQDTKNGTVLGVSGNEDDTGKNSATEMYAVVVEKKRKGFCILEINDLSTGNTLSLYEALTLIELSLKLDKVEGSFVPPDVVSTLFSDVLNGITFEFVTPLNYKEARNYFKEMLEKRKVFIPQDPSLIDSLSKITEDTPWEDYDSNAREIIATNWAIKNGKNVGLCLDFDEIPKSTIISYFKMIFTGEIKKKLIGDATKKGVEIEDIE